MHFKYKNISKIFEHINKNSVKPLQESTDVKNTKMNTKQRLTLNARGIKYEILQINLRFLFS